MSQENIHDPQQPLDGSEDPTNAFYLKFYSGHKGKFGHEFLEFEITLNEDGRDALLRYTNSSKYRNEDSIRKEVGISKTVVTAIKNIISSSEILKERDKKWPPKNRDGRQTLEIKDGREHINFETTKLGSLSDTKHSDDPDGLRVYYYFVQDLKALIFSLITLHFKVNPI